LGRNDAEKRESTKGTCNGRIACKIILLTDWSFFAFTVCFPNTDHVMTLWRFDPLSCSLKREHADILIRACTLFDEQDKGSYILSIITRSLLGKQNVQVKKIYFNQDRK